MRAFSKYLILVLFACFSQLSLAVDPPGDKTPQKKPPTGELPDCSEMIIDFAESVKKGAAALIASDDLVNPGFIDASHFLRIFGKALAIYENMANGVVTEAAGRAQLVNFLAANRAELTAAGFDYQRDYGDLESLAYTIFICQVHFYHQVFPAKWVAEIVKLPTIMTEKLHLPENHQRAERWLKIKYYDVQEANKLFEHVNTMAEHEFHSPGLQDHHKDKMPYYRAMLAAVRADGAQHQPKIPIIFINFIEQYLAFIDGKMQRVPHTESMKADMIYFFELISYLYDVKPIHGTLRLVEPPK